MERWKNVPLNEYKDAYRVSDKGRVLSVRNNMILKPKMSKAGYYRVGLSVNGEVKLVPIHRLVAMAFVENPDHKPTVNHKNEIKTDNRAENLEWATVAEQNVYGPRIERARAHTNYSARRINYAEVAQKHDYSLEEMCNRKRTRVIKNGKEWIFETQRKAAEFTGLSKGKVSLCATGKKKSCKGFVFEDITEGV